MLVVNVSFYFFRLSSIYTYTEMKRSKSWQSVRSVFFFSRWIITFIWSRFDIETLVELEEKTIWMYKILRFSRAQTENVKEKRARIVASYTYIVPVTLSSDHSTKPHVYRWLWEKHYFNRIPGVFMTIYIYSFIYVCMLHKPDNDCCCYAHPCSA